MSEERSDYGLRAISPTDEAERALIKELLAMERRWEMRRLRKVYRGTEGMFDIDTDGEYGERA